MAVTAASVRAAAFVMVAAVSAVTLVAQPPVKLPKNRYTPEQDVKLGREAADEVRQQYPVITDARIAGYLGRLGDRLVAAAPRSRAPGGGSPRSRPRRGRAWCRMRLAAAAAR